MLSVCMSGWVLTRMAPIVATAHRDL